MSIPTVLDDDLEPMDADFQGRTFDPTEVVSPITAASQHPEGWREDVGNVDVPGETQPEGLVDPLTKEDLTQEELDHAIESFDLLSNYRERLGKHPVISRDIATEALDLAPGLPLRPLGSFSTHPTLTNYEHSLEAIDRWLNRQEAQIKRALIKQSSTQSE